MAILTQASQELFRRSPDERFETLQSLWQQCYERREASKDYWQPPELLRPRSYPGTVVLGLQDDRAHLGLQGLGMSAVPARQLIDAGRGQLGRQ